MAEQARRELRLVRDDTAQWQFEGYQKLDDKLVIYRRYIPVTKELNSILIHLYDFNSYTLTIIVDAKGYNSSSTSSAMQVMHFRDLDNKQGIADAHQALADLGGTPPCLTEMLGIPTLSGK